MSIPSDPAKQESSIVPVTTNFALQRYIRENEIQNCTKSSMSESDCACILSGATDKNVCIQGYSAVKAQPDVLSDPFHLVKWCMNNQPNTDTDSWTIGCINGIRK